MRFLVICGPIIKFLFNKYIGDLSFDESLSRLIRKFNAQEILLPEESLQFIEVLSGLQNYLITNNIDYRIDPIRKLIGNGHKWTGLLKVLINQEEEVFLYLYEPSSFKNFEEQLNNLSQYGYSDIRIIAPLNLDENEEIYSFIHDVLKLPIYPFLHNNLTSKWLLNFTFSPNTPKTFYFPSDTHALDYIEKIKRIAKSENIEYFILKDEYDFDISPTVPYAITPLDKLDYYCALYYERSQGIANIGGLLIQEFLASNKMLELYKSHFYMQIISGGDIHYKTKIKPFEGGAFLNSSIENITEEITTIPEQIINILNAPIARYYPYLLSSIEYIIHNDHFHVIDINSIARSLNVAKDLEILPVDHILQSFINRIKAEENEDSLKKQFRNHQAMQSLYQDIRNLGPGFISGDRLIKLNDDSEHSVSKFCSNLFTMIE